MGISVEGLAVSFFGKDVKATLNNQVDQVGLTINSEADLVIRGYSDGLPLHNGEMADN
jgi:hypothetical protein